MGHARAGYLTVTGIAPEGDDEWEFLVAREMIEHLQRSGPRPKFYDSFLLGEILASPAAVFRGLKRDGFEEAYCYCGVPSRRMISTTVEAPPPPGRTFLVYVSSDHRGHVVLDWEWRPAHQDRQGLPSDYETSFGSQTWPKTS